MISNKAKYAFRALLAIAAAPEGEAMTSSEISRRYTIPHKFLEQILLDLKKAGILDSRRGKSGGYVMLRPADTVSFRSAEHTCEPPSPMRISYAVLCLTKKTDTNKLPSLPKQSTYNGYGNSAER